MIRKEVMLSIRGMQEFKGQDADKIELQTNGVLTITDDGIAVITYEESELTGLDGTTTSLTIEPKRITLVRYGGFNAQMIFEEGKTHDSLYETPYGALTIGIHTKEFACKIDENGGGIAIDYIMELDHLETGENKFRMKVKVRE